MSKPGIATPPLPQGTNPELARRIRGGRRQLIARAVGLHRFSSPSLCDATAGFGQDGLLFAALGARVELVERNDAIFAELAAAIAMLPEIWRARVRAFHAEARDHLLTGRWDVIYLDPMYLPGGKAALPRARAQRLRVMAGADDDADALLALARHRADRRVVVKRARRAPPLAGENPHERLLGNRVRFDLYLPDTPAP